MESEFIEEPNYIFDIYEHLDPKLVYTVTRLPGKGVSDSDFEYFKCGCDCSTSRCTKENNCSCLKYGVNYKLTNDGLIIEANKLGNVPIFECNLNCSCYQSLKNINGKEKLDAIKLWEVCPNRNVQFGPIENLEIFDAGPKGLGLKTRKTIRAGAFICEYAGEVIGTEEALKREMNTKGKMNYIFVLNEYAGEVLSKVTCIDPTHIGNIGRYINHSCQPNSVILPVRVNNPVPLLCIFALREIQANEEICYDYSSCEPMNKDCIYQHDRKPCFCYSITCKKFLPFQINRI